MLEKRQSFTFVWGFTAGDTVTPRSCTPLSIFVNRDPQNSGSQPVAPYTIIAYPDQGLPTVDLLGNSPDNMSWTPRFPAGTKVLLNVVDALGNSGGIAQTLYTLGTGLSTSCIPSTSSNDIRVTTDNTASTLQTCQVVPIRIQGGKKPYTITIAATNAPTAINATMDARNDYYQYVNRVAPGQTMIAAISDSNGNYAASTQFYSTVGPTDVTCGGQANVQSVYGSGGSSSDRSSPTTTTSGPSSTTSTSNNADKGGKPLTGAIVGTILGLLAIFGIIAFIFYRRRHSRRTQFDRDSTISGSGGFGMKDYKRGNNMPGNESFLPLADSDSLPRTPQAGSPQTAFATRRQSNLDYYSSPPSNCSGTNQSMGTSAISSSRTGPSQSTMSPPYANLGLGAAGRPQTKREMMAQEQQRQQQWSAANQAQERPESMYPPVSSYTVNPFGDNAYPYNPASNLGSAPPVHLHAPSQSFGSTAALGTGASASPASYGPYHPSHAGTGTAPRPSGSQDLTTMSNTMGAPMTPAARAKAAEAAQDARRAYADDDDDDLLAYTQPRMVLGVTNPDRASVATSNTTASADPYGGTAGHVGGASTPTQVYQHEDAGVVVELPPAYREFSRTPAPGSAPER